MAFTIPPGFELLGQVSVDSGHLLLVDPAYIDTFWSKRGDPPPRQALDLSIRSTAALALSKQRAGTIGDKNFDIAAVVSTGWGDGGYPVYVLRGTGEDEGRIMQVLVDFRPG